MEIQGTNSSKENLEKKFAPLFEKLEDKEFWRKLAFLNYTEDTQNTEDLRNAEPLIKELSAKTIKELIEIESLKLLALYIKLNPSALNASFYFDGDKIVPVAYAAFLGKVEILKFLHEKKAKLDWKDSLGKTVSDWAMEGKHKNAIDYLHSMGLSCNADL